MGLCPELPEVEALARFLAERTVGRVVASVTVGTISALKTYAPAPVELVSTSPRRAPGSAWPRPATNR